MKIPITDQFLLDVFKVVSEVEDALSFLVHPPKTWRELHWDANDPIYQKYRKMLKPQQFSRLIYYLKRKNLIKIKNLKNNSAIMLSKEGFDKAVRIQFRLENNNLEKRRDGKWTMLMFDVPEKYKKSRELLRSILRNLGYKLFQQSVWVTPYNVSKRTEDLLPLYNLDQFVRIFLIEKIK